MSVLRPGGLELTRYALQKTEVKQGELLLDIGCGDGSAALCAMQEFGQRVIAVDREEQAVLISRSLGVDARRMDAAELALDGQVFNTVLMECVLSLVEQKEQVLGRIHDLLRPGGHLIINDVYQKLDCGDQKNACVDLKELACLLEKLGMEIFFYEDRTKDLKTFLAQAIMSHGSLDAWFEAEGGWSPCSCQYGKGTGYFLLAVRKSYA